MISWTPGLSGQCYCVLIHSWESWGLGSVINLPKITQLVSGMKLELGQSDSRSRLPTGVLPSGTCQKVLRRPKDNLSMAALPVRGWMIWLSARNFLRSVSYWWWSQMVCWKQCEGVILINPHSHVCLWLLSDQELDRKAGLLKFQPS